MDDLVPEPVPQHIQTLLTSISQENGISKPRLEFTSGSGTGDNFIGKIYRVLIKDEVSESELHLVLKTPPASKQRREFLRVEVFFQNEAYVYKTILPALAQFSEERSQDESAPFITVPRLYGAALSDVENYVIVLEDMKNRGFIMANRRIGLDEAHCRLVLKDLARFHAASLALRHTNLEFHNRLTSQLTENVFVQTENTDTSSQSIYEHCRHLIKGRFPEGTLERTKFEQFSKDFRTKMRNLVLNASKLSVITHGDTWINNLLFKYNEKSETPEKLCLIDFQITRYGSLVLDLSYFLFTSTTKSLRDKHYDDFMASYHRDLTMFLEKMGLNTDEIAPWNIFQEELTSYGVYGWGMAMFVIPLFLADKDDLVGVDEDVGDGSPTKMFFKNSRNNESQLEERMSDILEDVVRLGYM